MILVARDDHFAPGQDRVDPPTYLETLVAGVVGAHVVGCGRKRVSLVGIEDDDVGVGANGDSAFLRVEPEHPGRSGGTDLYPALQAEPLFGYRPVIHELDPVLDPGQSVRNLGEVALT